jgi:hypothetical protein
MWTVPLEAVGVTMIGQNPPAPDVKVAPFAGQSLVAVAVAAAPVSVSVTGALSCRVFIVLS